MDKEEVADNKGKDIGYSWVSTSRFLFYCQLAVFVALIIGGCYAMWNNRYSNRFDNKPKIEVPGNTQFNPTYK